MIQIDIVIHRFAMIAGIAILMIQSFMSWGQLDDEFWFVAPEIIVDHGDAPILLRFATYNDPADIMVSMPANPDHVPYSFSMAPNSAVSIDLTDSLSWYENKPFNQVLDKGIHITSTSNISAYYEVNRFNNPDIFALKGDNALGTSFRLAYQNFVSNVYSNSPSGFDVVATEPNTTVTIVPTQDLIGHPAGVPFQVFLPEAGSTYSARAAAQWESGHPSGTTIESDLPVAVTIHDDSCTGGPFGGCTDLMGDQMVPTDLLGMEYIAVHGYLNGDDRIYLAATQDNTSIAIGGVDVGMINAGETYEHVLTTDAAYFETNAPVAVWQMTGFGCELGGAILPSIACTGSSSVTFIRSTNEFIGINLLVPSGGEDDFTFNGDPNVIDAAAFNPVPGTNDAWMYAQLDLGNQVPILAPTRIENSANVFHLGIIHGGASSGTRFGYFSDYGALKYQAVNQTVNACLGEPLALQVNLIENGLYQWTGPNNFSGQGLEVNLGNANLTMSGDYVIQGYTGECAIQDDTISVQVHAPLGPPTIPDDWSACVGQSTEWSADQANVTWTGPNGFTSNNALVTLSNATESQEGFYVATLNDPWCPNQSDSLFVNVLTEEELTVVWDDEKSFCAGQEVWLSLTPELNQDNPEVQWWWIPEGSTDGIPVSNETDLLVNEPGLYEVQTTTDGPCPVLGEGLFVVTVAECDLFIPNVITPGNDDLNNRFAVTNLGQFPFSSVRIFNRWGHEVFSHDDFGSTNGWLPDDNLSDGTYYYILNIARGDEQISVTTLDGTTEYVDFGAIEIHGTITVIK